MGFGVNIRFLLGAVDRAQRQARPLFLSLTKTVTQAFRAVCEILVFELASLFSKVLSDFCCNLTIGHLVLCFNSNDALPELVTLQPGFELALGLPRTKDQNGFCLTNRRNDLVIVAVKIVRKASVSLVLGQAIS